MIKKTLSLIFGLPLLATAALLAILALVVPVIIVVLACTFVATAEVITMAIAVILIVLAAGALATGFVAALLPLIPATLFLPKFAAWLCSMKNEAEEEL